MTQEKETSFLIAFSNPVPGQEDEYNAWYNDVHLKEVSAVDGFISGRRFKLTEPQMGGVGHKYKYVVIYEVKVGNAQGVLDNLMAAMPRMRIDPVIDLSDTPSFLMESIGDTFFNLIKSD